MGNESSTSISNSEKAVYLLKNDTWEIISLDGVKVIENEAAYSISYSAHDVKKFLEVIDNIDNEMYDIKYKSFFTNYFSKKNEIIYLTKYIQIGAVIYIFLQYTNDTQELQILLFGKNYNFNLYGTGLFYEVNAHRQTNMTSKKVKDIFRCIVSNESNFFIELGLNRILTNNAISDSLLNVLIDIKSVDEVTFSLN